MISKTRTNKTIHLIKSNSYEKELLFSICALVLSLTASAQIIKDTPKGKLIENLYRSSKSWVKKGWTGTQAGRYEGLVSKIVIGEDGCIYIYNPLSGSTVSHG